MVARIVSVVLCMIIFVGPSRAQMPLYKCVNNGVASYQQISCEQKATPAPQMGSHAIAPIAIEGTWKIVRNSIRLPAQSMVLLVQNGKYECKSCDPPLAFKADGSDQFVNGQPVSNTVAVTVVDAHAIQQTRKKFGRVVSVEMETVSADGKTATIDSTNYTRAGTVNATTDLTRLSNGPDGSHAISGSWKGTGIANVSGSVLIFTYKVQGQMLKKSTPSGESYSANLDGADAMYNDGSGKGTLSIKIIGNNTLEESFKRNGKVVDVQTLVVAPNRKSVTITDKDLVDGSTFSVVAIRP